MESEASIDLEQVVAVAQGWVTEASQHYPDKLEIAPVVELEEAVVHPRCRDKSATDPEVELEASTGPVSEAVV